MKQNLVLLPGLLCDAALWAPQIEALSDVAECWVPPSLAQGSVAAMAQSILQDAPFGTFALAGLSMGGYVCMEIMRQAPQRVTRLALLDTRAAADVPEETQRRRELIRLAQTERGFRPVTTRLLPLILHSSRLRDETLVTNVSAMAERTGIEAFVRQQHAIISRPDSRGDLANVTVPTLILCGRQDALTPLAHHQEMATLIAGAELIVVEDCGHLSTLERPEAVNAAMRGWLNRD